MSTFVDRWEHLVPDEYPEPAADDPREHMAPKRLPAFTDASAFAYRCALEGLGLSQEQIDEQIAKDVPIQLRPVRLRVRQAG